MERESVATLLAVCGTCSEAIKMMPVIQSLRQNSQIDVRICVTAQHKEMLDIMLYCFNVVPDYELNLIQSSQETADLSVKILQQLKQILAILAPERVLVQGDTTIAVMASLAAFQAHIPITHIEAGLRVFDSEQTWLQAVDRKLISCISDMSCAPTQLSRLNLLKHHVPATDIRVCGNPAIDALLQIRQQLKQDNALRQRVAAPFKDLPINKKLLVVTTHEHENSNESMQQICAALRRLAERKDVYILFSVPITQEMQRVWLDSLLEMPNIRLIEAADYLTLVYLISQAYLLLTNSNCLQEEAPSFGVPILIFRETVLHPEAIYSGAARVVGVQQEAIVQATEELLNDPIVYQEMAQVRFPFGNGNAGKKIADWIFDKLDLPLPASESLSLAMQ